MAYVRSPYANRTKTFSSPNYTTPHKKPSSDESLRKMCDQAARISDPRQGAVFRLVKGEEAYVKDYMGRTYPNIKFAILTHENTRSLADV